MQQLLAQYQGATSHTAQQIAGNALAVALTERRDLLYRIQRRVIRFGVDEHELPDDYKDPGHLTGLVFEEVFAKKQRHRITGQVRYIFTQYLSNGQFVKFAADKLYKRFLREKARDPLRAKSSDPAHMNSLPSSRLSREKVRMSYFREHFGSHLVASLATSRNNSVTSLIFCFIHLGPRLTKRKRTKEPPQLPTRNEVLLKFLDAHDWLPIARAATGSIGLARQIVTLVWPQKVGTKSRMARVLGTSDAKINRVQNKAALATEFQRCVDEAVAATRQLADQYVASCIFP